MTSTKCYFVQKYRNLQTRDIFQDPTSTHLLCDRHKCILPYSEHSLLICFMTDHCSLYILKRKLTRTEKSSKIILNYNQNRKLNLPAACVNN